MNCKVTIIRIYEAKTPKTRERAFLFQDCYIFVTTRVAKNKFESRLLNVYSAYSLYFCMKYHQTRQPSNMFETR